MKKIVVSVLLIMAVIVPTVAFADDWTWAKYTQCKIILDGRATNMEAFNINDNNYFKLRDVAGLFSNTSSKFDVLWNGETNTVEIITGRPYTPIQGLQRQYYDIWRNYRADITSSKVLVDGVLQDVKAYNIDNANYFMLRDLGKVIPFDVDWNEETQTIILSSIIPQNAVRTKPAYSTISNTIKGKFEHWANVPWSNIIVNADNTISVIEAHADIRIETYGEKYNLISNKTISSELPEFGGFFSGEKYNYIAFGQNNLEENDTKEIIRIVRYDKDFNKIDSVSVNGKDSYTARPFNSGSGRMAEYGNTLVFHTSREIYKDSAGVNHQAQFTMVIDTQSMEVTNTLGKFQDNHVSHSLDQYVVFEGGSHVLLDHGDGLPRSVVLQKSSGAGYTKVNMFKIPGAIGANATGVSVGGFETSGTSYIAAISTVDHSKVKEYTSFGLVGLETDQRDIILCTVPKGSLNDVSVKQVAIAKYVGTDQIASVPKLVKVSENKLMVMWQEFDMTGTKAEDVKYVFVDGNGAVTSEIKTVSSFNLSICQPVVRGNSVIWYANEGVERIFYSVPIE